MVSTSQAVEFIGTAFRNIELPTLSNADVEDIRHALCSIAATQKPVAALVEALYLIWSNEHRCWWRPDSCGYTQAIERAGRYSRAEALEIAGTGRGGWATDRNPSEIAILEADAIAQATDPRRLEVQQ